MTTAASAISPDGVWCCPTGLTWAASPPWCKGKVEASYFVSSQYGCAVDNLAVTFGGSDAHANSQNFTFVAHLDHETGVGIGYSTVTLQARDIVVTAQAKGIFLEGQTMTPTTTVPNNNNVNTEAISPPSGSNVITEKVISRSVSIPGIVCGVLGACILLGVVYVLGRRRRRRGRQAAQGDDDSAGASGDFSGTVDAEGLSDGYRKAELDASAQATRSELEGPVERNYGAGIYVQKPELEGTRAERHAEGAVYVRNKAELEGRLREIAELEAIPWSARRKAQTLPPSPTIPGLS
ncbi:uncharacterized protein F4812DRAFT_170992 [Daldinia caldariorum]|uniref:uncharacterized protein n=1 Tax=Daldinia caldariorum TaxID=326644 RepID=UPI002007AB4F|nr:uncharacterized protein F4812DRAFT_170992 [Daldinia caldariorum]KAI1471234.1 hypothetical protein F4812DRAFT_170992 [Daldinia caldariorum]